MALYLSVLPRCSSSVKLRGLLKAFVLGAVLCGCGDTPEAGLEELIAASNEGAVEKLFPRLTERSIPLVQTAAMVGGEEGPLAFSRSSVPVEILSLTPQGGTSVMVVREGEHKHILPWVEEGGRWKVDLFLMTGYLEGDRLPRLVPGMNP